MVFVFNKQVFQANRFSFEPIFKVKVLKTANLLWIPLILEMFKIPKFNCTIVLKCK